MELARPIPAIAVSMLSPKRLNWKGFLLLSRFRSGKVGNGILNTTPDWEDEVTQFYTGLRVAEAGISKLCG
jgi:hypothetical protein